jgi:ABC-2 type transport system permease protein
VKYLEVAKITYKAQLAFRFEIGFNMVFTIIKILFAYIIWGTIFGQRDSVAGFSFHSMLSYYIISSFLAQMEMSDGVSGEISARIREGTFSKYMVVPVRIQAYFLAQTWGAATFYGLFNLIAAVVWIFLFRIQFAITLNPGVILLSLCMILLGLMFMVQLNYFLGILTFKFQDIQFFLMIKNNLVAFITGTMLPLSLLPEGIVFVMRFFPFYYVTYLPSMLLIGQNTGEGVLGLFVLTGWIGVFMLLNHITYNRLRVRYDGVGI